MNNVLQNIYFNSPVFLQNLLVSSAGYKLFRKRYSGIYKHVKKSIDTSKRWSEEEKIAFQSEKLHQMVKHCRQHIPYYQELFSQHSIHENDITHTSDISKLPILRKQVLRENIEKMKYSSVQPFSIQNTSGSTGTPLNIWVDEITYKLAMALLVDHEETHNVSFGSRRATFAGRMIAKSSNTRPPFWRFNRAENQMLFSSYHLNEKSFGFYKHKLDQFCPLEIIGYPSAIYQLALLYENSKTVPNFQPKAIITNSETLLAWQRDVIERVFKCKIYDYYGTAEYVIFAGQDQNGNYQINPVIGLMELEAELNGTNTGKILGTTLVNRAMPLLRYEIGDTATALEPIIKSHTVVSSLQGIEGRTDDYILLEDGRKIGRIDHIFKDIKGIKEAQVIQKSIDHCTILVVSDINFASDDQEKLKRNFSERTSGLVQLSIERVPEIRRSTNGKFKAVVGLSQHVR